jgi:hypothetical protein
VFGLKNQSILGELVHHEYVHKFGGDRSTYLITQIKQETEE